MSLFANNHHFNHSGDQQSLENLLQQYPYFSHAHFLLLKQMSEADADYKAVAAKTALHFANPFLLDQQLKQDKPAADITIVHSVTTDTGNDVEIIAVSTISEEQDEIEPPPPPVEVESPITENMIINTPKITMSILILLYFV